MEQINCSTLPADHQVQPPVGVPVIARTVAFVMRDRNGIPVGVGELSWLPENRPGVGADVFQKPVVVIPRHDQVAGIRPGPITWPECDVAVGKEVPGGYLLAVLVAQRDARLEHGQCVRRSFFALMKKTDGVGRANSHQFRPAVLVPIHHDRSFADLEGPISVPTPDAQSVHLLELVCGWIVLLQPVNQVERAAADDDIQLTVLVPIAQEGLELPDPGSRSCHRVKVCVTQLKLFSVNVLHFDRRRKHGFARGSEIFCQRHESRLIAAEEVHGAVAVGIEGDRTHVSLQFQLTPLAQQQSAVGKSVDGENVGLELFEVTHALGAPDKTTLERLVVGEPHEKTGVVRKPGHCAFLPHHRLFQRANVAPHLHLRLVIPPQRTKHLQFPVAVAVEPVEIEWPLALEIRIFPPVQGHLLRSLVQPQRHGLELPIAFLTAHGSHDRDLPQYAQSFPLTSVHRSNHQRRAARTVPVNHP